MTSPGAAKIASYVALIVTFLCLNTSLNLLNKWALGHAGFRFPFLLTSCHMAFSFVMLAPVALMQPWESHRTTLAKQWKGVLYIGSFMALNIALNNISLLDISLSLNQIIRSAIPVVACVLAIVVESKYPSKEEAASLLVLSLGVMLAVWQGTIAGKPYAIAFSIGATVCNGAMMTFSSKLMSEKLDVVRLAFYTAPVSLACLAPFCWIYEREAFMPYLAENRQAAGAILLLSSINALAYNLAHQTMIKQVSAVATTVIGEFKIICLLVLSAVLLGEGSEFTLKMTVGCVMALVGFGSYSHIKLRGSFSSSSSSSSGSLSRPASAGGDSSSNLELQPFITSKDGGGE